MSVTINPAAYYRPTDDDLAEIIGSPSTLAQWRHLGHGPNYHKLHKGRGSRVLYHGQDLLDWLERKRVPVPGTAA